jgi:hypothetical protein
MSRLLLAVASTVLGLVISWSLYTYVVGSIGPVELLELLLLAVPIALTLYRVTLPTTPPRRRPAPRRAGSAPRSR